jgi:hypothetical protein
MVVILSAAEKIFSVYRYASGYASSIAYYVIALYNSWQPDMLPP